jgi:hypothetical protein
MKVMSNEATLVLEVCFLSMAIHVFMDDTILLITLMGSRGVISASVNRVQIIIPKHLETSLESSLVKPHYCMI